MLLCLYYSIVNVEESGRSHYLVINQRITKSTGFVQITVKHLVMYKHKNTYRSARAPPALAEAATRLVLEMFRFFAALNSVSNLGCAARSESQCLSAQIRFSPGGKSDTSHCGCTGMKRGMQKASARDREKKTNQNLTKQSNQKAESQKLQHRS